MKAPVKMLFPTVIFIFPSMFIVILGPAFLNISKVLTLPAPWPHETRTRRRARLRHGLRAQLGKRVQAESEATAPSRQSRSSRPTP